MSIERVVSRALAVSLVLLVSASLRAETAGAPLKGVDVKLGRNPGNAARTMTTDDKGVLQLGTLARGSYFLLFASEPKPTDPVVVSVEIKGATGGTTTYGYNRKSASIVYKDRVAVVTTAAERAKQTSPQKIVFEADGTNPVMITIVKSKSNIRNN